MEPGDEMKSVCIVGGSGYLGTEIAYEFLEKGFRVVIFKRVENLQPKIKEFEYLYGNLLDEVIVGKIASGKFNVIVYCASFDHSQAQICLVKTLQNNNLSFATLIKVLANTGFEGKLIYLSSAQVYGNVETCINIGRETLTSPNNNYGLSHLLNEQILKLASNKFRFEILRLTNGYGPSRSSNKSESLVLHDMCISAVKSGIININSDGKPQRDFIYINDISQVIYQRSIDEDYMQIQNICSGVSCSILEAAFVVKNVFYEKFQKDTRIFLQNIEVSNLYDQGLVKKTFEKNQAVNIKYLSLKQGIELYVTDLIRNLK
jgi:UDP-glucose 4-epimerase